VRPAPSVPIGQSRTNPPLPSRCDIQRGRLTHPL
jgi:hypothetical protein